MGGDVNPLTSLPTSTNPIRGTLKNPQLFLKRVGNLPISDAQIFQQMKSHCSIAAVYQYSVIVVVVVVVVVVVIVIIIIV